MIKKPNMKQYPKGCIWPKDRERYNNRRKYWKHQQEPKTEQTSMSLDAITEMLETYVKTVNKK